MTSGKDAMLHEVRKRVTLADFSNAMKIQGTSCYTPSEKPKATVTVGCSRGRIGRRTSIKWGQ